MRNNTVIVVLQNERATDCDCV